MKRTVKEDIQKFAAILKAHGWVFLTPTNTLYHPAEKQYQPLSTITGMWKALMGDTYYDDTIALRLVPELNIPFVAREKFCVGVESELVPSASGINYLNTYRPFTKVKSTLESESLSPYFDYMAHMFPVQSEREFVEKWIAQIIQDPTHRLPYHLLITGTTGTGKGTFFYMLRHLIGSYADVGDSDKIFGDKHSTYFVDNLLIHLNDWETETRKVQQKLNPLITDDTMSVRRLYQEAREENIYARVIWSSNSFRPLRLRHDDRRWYCTEYNLVKRDTRDFKEWLTSGGINLIHDHLSRLDIGDMPSEAPMTTTKQEMIGASYSILDNDIQRFAETHIVFTLKEFEQAHPQYGNSDLQKVATKLSATLGYKKSPIFRKVTPTPSYANSNFYYPSDVSPSEARDIYRARSQRHEPRQPVSRSTQVESDSLPF